MSANACMALMAPGVLGNITGWSPLAPPVVVARGAVLVAVAVLPVTVMLLLLLLLVLLLLLLLLFGADDETEARDGCVVPDTEGDEGVAENDDEACGLV